MENVKKRLLRFARNDKIKAKKKTLKAIASLRSLAMKVKEKPVAKKVKGYKVTF